MELSPGCVKCEHQLGRPHAENAENADAADLPSKNGCHSRDPPSLFHSFGGLLHSPAVALAKAGSGNPDVWRYRTITISGRTFWSTRWARAFFAFYASGSPLPRG